MRSGEARQSQARGVPRYDVGDFRLSDLTTCGAELRRVGLEARSVEDAARRIVETLRDRFVNPSTGRRSFVLARFFLCTAYEKLDTELQADVRSFQSDRPPSSELKCLALLGSVGDRPEWNSRHSSRNHRVVPLANAAAVESRPMLAQLLIQLGFDPRAFVQPDPDLMVARQQTSYNVFHVPEARLSRYVPDQADFARPHGVRSVLGFGGVVPPDDTFAIVLFSRDPISRSTAEMFKPLALSAKIAVLSSISRAIFD